jgi:hypothetical protein
VTDDRLTEASRDLLAAVSAEFGPWIGGRSLALAPDLVDALAGATAQATAQVVDALVKLLGADIDAQTKTPLGVVRDGTAVVTAVLRDAGVAPVHRDRWQQEAEPDDIYDLQPVTWADIGPACAETGLVWGAAKAMTHLARHRPPTD